VVPFAEEEMKKSVNRFTVLLWGISGFYVIAMLFTTCFTISEIFTSPKTLGDHEIIRTMFAIMPGAIYQIGMLIAFGYIIELLDKIRWSLSPPQ
jgi:hypothetical protein